MDGVVVVQRTPQIDTAEGILFGEAADSRTSDSRCANNLISISIFFWFGAGWFAMVAFNMFNSLLFPVAPSLVIPI